MDGSGVGGMGSRQQASVCVCQTLVSACEHTVTSPSPARLVEEVLEACHPHSDCPTSTNTRPSPATHLVDEVLEVVVAEWLGGADNLVQVCVHQLIHLQAGHN